MDNDRVRETQQRALSRRIGMGSAYLGTAWRNGHRCGGGWTGHCGCDAPTPFCQGKLRWVGLLLELHDGQWPYGLTGDEPFAIIEAMTVDQFEASGLTALVEAPGASRPLRIPPGGTLLEYAGKNEKKYWLRSSWWMIVDLALTNPGKERKEVLGVVEKLQEHLAS